jgi:resolvase-like protein/recombinase
MRQHSNLAKDRPRRSSRTSAGRHASNNLPQIEGTAGRFMLKQMALVAELEAGFISDRTKAALAAAKRRGKTLGGFRAGARLTAKARQKGADANAKAAAARAADLAPVIAELQASGAASLRAIARALNDRGIPTARGGKWFAASVRDVLGKSGALNWAAQSGRGDANASPILLAA